MPELETTPNSNDNPSEKPDGLVFDVDDNFSYDGDSDFVLDEDGNWVENDISHFEAAADQQANSDNKFGDNPIIFAEYAIAGIRAEDLSKEHPEEAALYQEWLGSLDEDTKLIINERKRAQGRYDVVKGEMLKSCPDLLQGKLPAEQANKLASGKYVLGVNQSQAFSIEDAKSYLKEDNGIGLGIYGLDQRFLLLNEASTNTDAEYTEQVMVGGYYQNSNIGRFIVAVPTGEHNAVQDAVNKADAIADFTQQTNEAGGRSVSPKYIAGFVDSLGVYHENRNFGVSNEPLFGENSKEESGAVEKFELSGLNDDEYLNLSQTFASEYKGLVNGQVETEFQKRVSEKVSKEIAPIIEKIEHLSGQELAKFMVEGYRSSLNKLYVSYGKEAPFKDEAVSGDNLKRIVRIDKGPYGIPIIFTDGFNEELFGDDTLSFAATELMLENGLPPAVIVYDKYKRAGEKEEVTTHETSHAVFTLLRRAGVIPSPDGEGVTVAGKKSAFELARDEAIAQLTANQNGVGHPSVHQRMKSENYSDEAREAYLGATGLFKRTTAEDAGLSFSDAILGVVTAKNFDEFNSHMNRMAQIASSKKGQLNTAKTTISSSKQSSIGSGWGAI